MSTHHKKQAACPNCGTDLKPEYNFCPSCGQENHDLHVPFRHLFLELFESVFHFETKFFTTLKVIFTQPGKITRDFWEGKRARYMHPFRLYVFVSFVFFLIANKVADKTAVKIGDSIKKVEQNNTARIAEIEDLVRRKPHSDSVVADNGLTPFTKVDLLLPIDSAARYRFVGALKQWNDNRLDSLLQMKQLERTAINRSRLRQTLAMIPDTTNIPSVLLIGPASISFSTIEERVVFTQKLRTFSDNQVDSLLVAIKAEPTRFNHTLLKQLAKFDLEDRDFLQSVAHAFMKNLSVVMFLLMPFVALLLLAVFYDRHRYYFEHLIFSIHAHTILFVLYTITLTIDYFMDTTLATKYASLIGWVYFLLSLKRVYQQGWLLTISKFLGLSIAYLVVIWVFTATAFLWGLMTF